MNLRAFEEAMARAFIWQVGLTLLMFVLLFLALYYVLRAAIRDGIRDSGLLEQRRGYTRGPVLGSEPGQTPTQPAELAEMRADR